MDRVQRCFTDNIFLMESLPSRDDDGDLEKKFIVMGSTGNLYTVTISYEPDCTCPDHRINKKRCKHIYFILIRVMKSSNEKQCYYDDEELKTMFENIPEITRNLIPKASIRKTYKKIKTQEGEDDDEDEEEEQDKEKGKDEEKIVEQKPYQGDSCPICLDDLEGKDIDYCKYSCGKSIHKVCFKMWCKKNNNTCVYCRCEWVIVTAKEKSPSKKTDWLIRRGYINVLNKVEKKKSKSKKRKK